MRRTIFLFFFLCSLIFCRSTEACSVLYYVDPQTGKIYVANNEDYWYDVEAYIQIMPETRKKLARMWYGWDDFAQGGINEAGLFFDGAVTPEQLLPGGGHGPRGNLGDDLLANCKSVDEALLYLEKKEIALNNAHMMLGDSAGNAVVVEWLAGRRKIVPLVNNRLVMTNFLLSDTSLGNYPCPRHQAIETRLDQMEEADQTVNLKVIGNVIAGAVQVPQTIEDNRVGGTLYSSFINISDMEFILVYQLDNSKITRLDLKGVFKEGKKKRIKLK